MTIKRSVTVELQLPLRCAEPTPANMELEQDDIAWATRSGMWQSRVGTASARRTRRAKAQPALVLAGDVVLLRIENGALEIKNGFTHYTRQREIMRYFRGDIGLPERIILLDGSGSISFDVLSWLAVQKGTFIRIAWKGGSVCVAGASGYSANPFRVRGQLETRENPELRNEFCRSIITRKIEATITTLESEIRIKAVSDGYGPTIGIMHEGSDGWSKLIFDLMEPQRPKVDRAVLDFVKRTVFDPADFTIRNDGFVRLNPQLARHVANLTTRALRSTRSRRRR
jgi:CRISPR associated protein Cas1